MYIAYSSPLPEAETAMQLTDAHELKNHEFALRYNAYKSICKKFSSEIAAIQKYFPGWQPEPPVL